MIQNIFTILGIEKCVAEQSNVSNVESRTDKLEQSLEDLQVPFLV